MNMDRMSSDIEIIIYRYLTGELSEEEREVLDSWLEDDKHKVWFEKMCDKENIFRKSLHFDVLDKGREESWKVLERKTGLRKKRVLQRFMFAASFMLPLFIAGGLFFFQSDREKVKSKKQYVKIMPGSSNAQLYLSSGRVIDLAKDSVCDLKLSSGGLLKNKQGILTYQNSNLKDSVCRYHEIKIPRGGEYKVVLPDGSSVWLNSESSLRFPDSFIGKTRKVYAEGELYFEVERNENKPFQVEVNGEYTIEVLGTEFNLRSYNNAPCATTLVEGSVLIKGKDKDVILKPGQQIVSQKGGSGFEVKEVDVSVFSAWRHGNLRFVSARLEDIMAELSRWYDVEVFFQKQSAKDERFSVEMKRFDDFSKVTKLIERTGVVKFKVNKHVVIIK